MRVSFDSSFPPAVRVGLAARVPEPVDGTEEAERLCPRFGADDETLVDESGPGLYLDLQGSGR